MIVAVPGATPVTNPAGLIVTLALLLAHDPPATASVNVIVPPTHTAPVPFIRPGAGLTVTTVVTKQSEASVYVITEVPAVTAVTIPVDDPIITLPLLLVHTPPPTASVSVTVEDAHSGKLPFIGLGNGSTEITIVA